MKPFIAPPHGLHGAAGDKMPHGCPEKNDPVEVANKMAERSITLYCVGCEPSLKSYRQFFQAIALITGGKYVPLDQAENLAEVFYFIKKMHNFKYSYSKGYYWWHT
jgi:Mg-chelatase subunit ChlD